MATRSIRLVYIVSPSHSGSTLLDLLLNAHSQMASVGELKKFGTVTLTGDRPCSCGEKPLSGCDFWPRVVSRLKQLGWSAGGFRADRGDPEANLALLQSLSETTGGAILVDSSKLTRRLRLVQSLPGVEVLPVFLVRDPRGQICSTLRKRRGLIRAIRNYNRQIREIRRQLRSQPHVRVDYERLVAAPEAAMRPILAHFGMTFEEAQRHWASAEKHSLGGNRMRHGKDSIIRGDERWRRDLLWSERALIQLGTWWTRRRLARPSEG